MGHTSVAWHVVALRAVEHAAGPIPEAGRWFLYRFFRREEVAIVVDDRGLLLSFDVSENAARLLPGRHARPEVLVRHHEHAAGSGQVSFAGGLVAPLP